MEQEKILSVIIPTYNMEKYLCRCLDSLIIDKGIERLEVLIINDGSEDSSSDLAHEYQDKYSDIFHVIDKENGNYGSCINRGLKEATGKYIRILDADDSLNIETLEEIIGILKNVDNDVVLTNSVVVKDEVKKEKHFLNYVDGQLIKIDDEVVAYFSMHNVIYKRNLLKKIGYLQTEGMPYTDQEWIFYPMLYADTVVFFNLSFYQYTLGREGQTMNWNSICRNISSIEYIVRQMFVRLLNDRNNISVCRRVYAENVLRVQLELIYKIELLSKKKENSNIKALRQIETLMLSYDVDFYKSFNNQTINWVAYVKWFRKGVVFSNRCRRLLLSLYKLRSNSNIFHL